MKWKFIAGLLLGFGIGFGCRAFGVPVPAPPVLVGALLVVAMTSGYMLAGSAPYLVSGRDAYDPGNPWTKVIPMSAFQARFASTYPLASITVTTHPGAGGWVDTVTLTGTNGKSNEISGESFRAWAGLRSASFRFTP